MVGFDDILSGLIFEKNKLESPIRQLTNKSFEKKFNHESEPKGLGIQILNTAGSGV